MSAALFNSRKFLAESGTASTSNIVCYSGPSPWDGGDQQAHFVSISDCHSAVRLHKTDQESLSSYISKLEALRDELSAYISWLSSTKGGA